jgi:hypothetical protein
MTTKATIGRAVGGATMTLTALAIAQELRKPKRRRRWHGTVLGVPYDFRRPTLKRARSRMWNRRERRLFTPRTFGLGWDLNLARLLRR